MMTVIKIFFIILILIPIGMLMRYLLGKLSAEVPAQTDSVEIRSGRMRKARGGAKATKTASGAASGKANRKAQDKAPVRTDNNEDEVSRRAKQKGSYRSRQPKEWSRSDRVPFGESEGYRVPQPGSRKRGAETSPWRTEREEMESPWSQDRDIVESPWRRETVRIESPWRTETEEIENPWRTERERAQSQGRGQGAGGWRKPSDAVRERVAEDSAHREIPEQEAQPISERKSGSGQKDSGPKKEKRKTGKKRSDKSPSKRQLRKNRERARKRDLKKRREEGHREGGR